MCGKCEDKRTRPALIRVTKSSTITSASEDAAPLPLVLSLDQRIDSGDPLGLGVSQAEPYTMNNLDPLSSKSTLDFDFDFQSLGLSTPVDPAMSISNLLFSPDRQVINKSSEATVSVGQVPDIVTGTTASEKEATELTVTDDLPKKSTKRSQSPAAEPPAKRLSLERSPNESLRAMRTLTDSVKLLTERLELMEASMTAALAVKIDRIHSRLDAIEKQPRTHKSRKEERHNKK